jgi:hypothetical protein
MRVRELYEALRRELPEGTPLKLGPEHLPGNETAKPPRLVLVPSDDTFDTDTNRAKQPSDPPLSQRAPYARLSGFRLVIWGRDYDSTEGMRDEVAGALRKLCGSALILRPSGWEQDEAALAGHKYIYELNFAVHVLFGAPPDDSIYATLQSVAIDDQEVLAPGETL